MLRFSVETFIIHSLAGSWVISAIVQPRAPFRKLKTILLPRVNRDGSLLLITLKTFLAYKRNSRRTSPLPWIAPLATDLGWSMKPPACSTWFLGEGCDVNDNNIRLVITCDLIFFGCLRCYNLSKAFATSKRTTVTDFHALAIVVIAFRQSVIQVTQGSFGEKCWQVFRRLWFIRYGMGRFLIKPSMILETIGSWLIGRKLDGPSLVALLLIEGGRTASEWEVEYVRQTPKIAMGIGSGPRW